MTTARQLIEAEDPKAIFRQMHQQANEYHFSIGNSASGPVGYAAVVVAATPEEALDILKKALPDGMQVPSETGELPPFVRKPVANERGVVYIEAYFNTHAITLQNITSVEPRQVRAQ